MKRIVLYSEFVEVTGGCLWGSKNTEGRAYLTHGYGMGSLNAFIPDTFVIEEYFVNDS